MKYNQNKVFKTGIRTGIDSMGKQTSLAVFLVAVYSSILKCGKVHAYLF